ncbi:MAG: hypothetical protein AAF989_15585, partial [Planctomycetota bacterium]
MMKLPRSYRPCRRVQGVTLVEVLFSIGVILIGLVGLLSLLPLAGYQAQDAISMNAGVAISNAARERAQDRRYHFGGRLVAIPERMDATGICTEQFANFRNLPGVLQSRYTLASVAPGIGFCIDPS